LGLALELDEITVQIPLSKAILRNCHYTCTTSVPAQLMGRRRTGNYAVVEQKKSQLHGRSWIICGLVAQSGWVNPLSRKHVTGSRITLRRFEEAGSRPGAQLSLIHSSLWLPGKVVHFAFVRAKPSQEVFLCFDWVVAQFARRKELDLTSSAHREAWGSVFALEDDKTQCVHSG
jgi:hypothetical protein